MRKNILITILLLFSILLFGQVPDKKTEKRLTELSDSIRSLNKQVLELKEKKEWNTKILEERLEQASNTISNQNSLFDGFGVLYTVITIILAVAAIGVPIITYQFGVKPSQAAIKELEQNMDSKIDGYLVKTRDRQIDQAIENIKINTSETKPQAITFLTLTQHQGFTEQQLFKISRLLKNKQLDDMTLSQIAGCISNKKNEYASEFFQEQASKIPAIGPHIKQGLMRYFSTYDLAENINVFRKLLSTSAMKYSEFATITLTVVHSNRQAPKILINDKEFVDSLSDQDLEMLKAAIPTYKLNWHMTEEEFQSSYLNSKLKQQT